AVLLHGDFKPSNLHRSGEDLVVLDWEFAWAGPALMDVGQLLRWSPPAAFVAGFAAAYLAGGGVLPAGWRRLAELFDLFNLVGLLEAPGKRRAADVSARVRRTLGRTRAT
ncbi:MAG: phosphotransferase, partial [Elusimicrobia bacterium]|nr:phosphotransferase [Elusimicrobiota bacterium]